MLRSTQQQEATAAGSGKQPKGAKGSSSAVAAPASTAKSKAVASSSAAGSSQGLGSQTAKKPPLAPPVDPSLEGEDEIAEEEEQEPKVSDMVVDPDHDVSKERERSISASAATRLLVSSRTGARLELRSNQEVKQSTPRRTWRGSRAVEEKGNPEEASGSLKRPHSSVGGSAKKRGQSVAFKEGHRKWDRMVAKRELEEVDEAAELWNYLRGKASKIDFSDLSDVELNLIAAGLSR